ncbi:ABC transporter ATP-binding protein [Lacticaseibacillus porcinae]|uniref:ABC transporter ATP-binding protein n=1 Tax=Lacticaseibacillus porcinae TaxID=1123687 RepID=UPI001CDB5902|nr:ABC transporter ATP-binding protein [Lacticaseibacillus porcinae]
MADIITGTHLTIGYNQRVILRDQELHIPAGQITGLIGPNGSGKSTLLKAIAQINSLTAGELQLQGQPLSDFSSKQLATKLAYLAQSPEVPGDLTVATLVKLGRYAYHQGMFGADPDEKVQVQAAMLQAKVADLADRPLNSLSGGQRQRAMIAMTLAQNAEILLLDEPTTYLDLTHQLSVLNLMQCLNRDMGKTIVVVLHDLNQAARYCEHLICVHDGKLVATGTPKQVLTDDLLASVFGVKAELVTPTGCDYPQLLNTETLEDA